jgi:hypothetical protein
VTADHGEEWFDHGALFHGFTLYNELLRVPLIFYSPGMKPARREGPVANIDLLPTLSDWLDIDPPPSLDGKSVADALLDSGEFRNEIHASTSFTKDLDSIEAGSFKLTRESSAGRIMLFDLKTDPRESQNRAGKYPDRARQLVTRLDDIPLDLSAETRPREAKASPSRNDTEKLIRELKSLGYLGRRAEAGSGDIWPPGHRVSWHDLYEEYGFIRLGDPRFRYDPGMWRETPDNKYSFARDNSKARIQLQLAARETFIVFGSNSESGIVQLRVDGRTWKEVDLYSDDRLDIFSPGRAPRQFVVPIEYEGPALKELEIVPTGRRNRSAKAATIYFKGVVLSKRQQGDRPIP